jgi:hypothetical protein
MKKITSSGKLLLIQTALILCPHLQLPNESVNFRTNVLEDGRNYTPKKLVNRRVGDSRSFGTQIKSDHEKYRDVSEKAKRTIQNTKPD